LAPFQVNDRVQHTRRHEDPIERSGREEARLSQGEQESDNEEGNRILEEIEMGALHALDIGVLDLDDRRPGVDPYVLGVHDRSGVGAHATGAISEGKEESDEREARDSVGAEGRGV
jgi:hypothetical protein